MLANHVPASLRQRLGAEPMAELFAQVAVPVAEEETQGAFLGPWRLMAIDGFEWDVPATGQNAAAFGFTPGNGSASVPSQCSGSSSRRPRIGIVVRGSANCPFASCPSPGPTVVLIVHWS